MNMQKPILEFWATLTSVERTVLATLLDVSDHAIHAVELTKEKDIWERLRITEEAAQGDVSVLPRRDRHSLCCLLERNPGMSVAAVIRHYLLTIERHKANFG